MNPPYIDIHTHHCTSGQEVKKVCVHLLGRNNPIPDNLFVAGVHPWDVKGADPAVLDFFNEKPSGCIGVGEIGLDFSRQEIGRELQMEWLNRQLVLAEKLSLPVVLHCVKAYNEILAELKKYSLKAVVFHGFIGSVQLSEQLVEQGYYLSFGEFSLHSPKTVDVLKNIPADNMFLETDDDPGADIFHIYREVALLRSLTMDQLKQAIQKNYKRVFDE